ncbi:MAG: BatD family protein, partial [bacterium]
MLRGMSLLVFALGACGPASAEPTVTAVVDRTTVGAGEPFRFTVAVAGVDGSVPDPQIPQVPNLEVYPAGRSQNVSIVNGAMSSSVTFQFTLVARAAGRVVVPSVAYVIGGKTYATDAIAVSVTTGPRGAAAGQAAPAGPPPYFATAEVSKRRPWVGEQLFLTLKLWFRGQVFNATYQLPDFSGFMVEPMPQRQYQAAHGGTAYNVFEVKYALFPTAPGNSAVGAAGFQFTIAEAGGGDPFAAFFGTGRKIAVKTDPVPLVVQALPDAGRPAGFTGAVGTYRVRALLDHPTVEAGRPVSLTFEVAGRGLVKSLREPAWPELPTVRRYETVTSLDAKSGAEGLQGAKTFKTVLIPSASGKLTIPAIAYPVFDPAANRYVTLRTDPLSLAVKPGTGPAAAPLGLASAPASGAVRLLASDI